MLRVLRATVARSRGSSFFVKSVARFHPICSPSQNSHFAFLQSPRQGQNGSPGRTTCIPQTQQLSGSPTQESLNCQDFADDCESSKPAQEDNILATSDFDNDDEDEGDLVAVSSSDPTDELDEDCVLDMSNVPEHLKEMLKDDYEIENEEEDVSFEGTAELLTISEVKQVLEEVRARDVQIFSVQDRCEWTDVMVVATGISDRHVRGIADALVYKIKKKGNIESPLYPTIEGQAGGNWLVVDCGNIVIHVLNEDSRAYYRLEDLWTGDVRPSTTDEDLEKMLRHAGLKDVVP